MPMTPEERQEYNKQYYQTNKQKALQKASIRVRCVCCDRIVSKNRLLAHMKTNLCLRTQNNENYINDRLNGVTIVKEE